MPPKQPPSRTLKNQTIFWSMVFIVILGFIAAFKSVLLPFILGIAIAYFLNPVIEKLSKYKINRCAASLFILVLFFLVIGLAIAALAPLLIKEITGFIEELPMLIEQIMVKLEPILTPIQTWVGGNETQDWIALARENATNATDVASSVLGGILAGGLAFIDFLSLIVITPVMAYFMMKEWPKITAGVDDLLPRNSRGTILSLLKEIDQKLSAFVRGQITVVIILALGYALVLGVAGLKFGVLIGITAGLLSIIPMVGSVLGLVVAVAVAFIQSGEWSYAGMIALIFMAGQVIESYFLTPKLVGNSVGLHPLWVFFVLMAGGSLFGIVGMLVAVPIAAVASVLVAFALAQYKKSPYYAPSGKKKSVKKKTVAQNDAA